MEEGAVYEDVEDNKGAKGRWDKVKDLEFVLGQVQFEIPIKYVI